MAKKLIGKGQCKKDSEEANYAVTWFIYTRNLQAHQSQKEMISWVTKKASSPAILTPFPGVITQLQIQQSLQVLQQGRNEGMPNLWMQKQSPKPHGLHPWHSEGSPQAKARTRQAQTSCPRQTTTTAPKAVKFGWKDNCIYRSKP